MKTRTFLLVVFAIFTQCYAQEGAIGLDELLLKYQQTFIADYPTISYNTEVKTMLSKSNSNENLQEDYYMAVHRKNDFLDVTVKKNFITDNRQYVDRGIITDKSISFSQRIGSPVDFVSITADPKGLSDRHRGWQMNRMLGSVLDGYVLGSSRKTLPEVLKEEQASQYSIAPSVLDAKSVILATFKTKYGTHKLWLDPDAGYCPRKIVLEKHKGDLHYSNDVIGQKPEPLPEGVTVFFPREIINNIIITAYPIEVQKIGDSYFPVSATVIEQDEYKNGVIAKTECTIVQKDIDLNPDFEKLGAFKLKPGEIPDGTPVYFRDERGVSGVEYEWFNDKIRAKIDDSFLGLLNTEIKQLKNKEELSISKLSHFLLTI